MTRAMKVTFILSAVLGIAVGARIGYSQGEDLSELMRTVEPMGAGLAVSAFAAQQFRHADADHARQATLLQISVFEQLRVATNDTNTRHNLGLAYVRLALVEKSAGNQEAERLALTQARTWLPARPGQDASDQQLEDFLKRLDQVGIGSSRTPKTTTGANSRAHSSLE